MKNGRGQSRRRIILGVKTHPQQAQVPNSTVVLPLHCLCVSRPISPAWLGRSSEVPSAHARHDTQSIIVPLITIYIYIVLFLDKLLFEWGGFFKAQLLTQPYQTSYFGLEIILIYFFLATKSLFKVEMTLIALEILTQVVDAIPLTLLGI